MSVKTKECLHLLKGVWANCTLLTSACSHRISDNSCYSYFLCDLGPELVPQAYDGTSLIILSLSASQNSPSAVRMVPNSEVMLCVLFLSMTTGAYAGPCEEYSILNDAWRSVDYIRPSGADYHCDQHSHAAGTISSGLTEGWYRFTGPAGNLMPTASPGLNHCGTAVPVWLNGPHPTFPDGVVTRQACGFFFGEVCHYSWDIQVAACPAGFYVYYLMPPPQCNIAYCVENGDDPPVVTTAATTTTTPTTTTTAETTTTKATTVPCDQYSVLDDDWRSVTNSGSDRHCDRPGYQDSTGLTEGWYRFTGTAGNQMPTAAPGSTHLCGTFAPVWLNGAHPAVADGVVTRQACAYRDSNYPCAWRWDIQVAACPGGFYVYHLIPTPTCNLGYCVENGAGPTVATTTMMTTTAITDIPSPPIYNSLCYKLSEEVTKDYESSALECAAKGGSLALIGDAATQSFVADLIRDRSNVSHWAGSTAPAVHCSYSGPSAGIDHDLWAPGHPPIFCVYMDSGAGYKFNVAVCSEEHGFVCQSG
ncbi:uncharacterized protein LOC118424994 [Branchiostoma floridae]|uniref:Uncharacterized protein LOC118424994 n=1 Tax=Branchiostoma floridae TaxID=7739 RepID=A0A9J7N4Z4_BRAFL|nr:uncharacterized protein LOC118424994 [Branchiostoma floridae]